jgi:hypothetical protein
VNESEISCIYEVDMQWMQATRGVELSIISNASSSHRLHTPQQTTRTAGVLIHRETSDTALITE